MTAIPPRQQPASATHGRVLPWLAALLPLLLLLLQLFAAIGHDHDGATEVQDCVACAVHAQAHAAPPVLAPALAPPRAVLLVGFSSVEADRRPTAPVGWLLPQPHAPPAFLFAS